MTLIRIKGPRAEHHQRTPLRVHTDFASKIQDFFQTFNKTINNYCLFFKTQGYQNSQTSFFHDALQTYSNHGAMRT